MDRLGALTVFIKVVETGSFSEAGRQSGQAPSSVSRGIVDHDPTGNGRTPLKQFESGAILVYLAEKTGMLLGEIFRNSGSNCSPLEMLTGRILYSIPASSRKRSGL